MRKQTGARYGPGVVVGQLLVYSICITKENNLILSFFKNFILTWHASFTPHYVFEIHPPFGSSSLYSISSFATIYRFCYWWTVRSLQLGPLQTVQWASLYWWAGTQQLLSWKACVPSLTREHRGFFQGSCLLTFPLLCIPAIIRQTLIDLVSLYY